jgi:hypothetical protein
MITIKIKMGSEKFEKEAVRNIDIGCSLVSDFYVGGMQRKFRT